MSGRWCKEVRAMRALSEARLRALEAQAFDGALVDPALLLALDAHVERAKAATVARGHAAERARRDAKVGRERQRYERRKAQRDHIIAAVDPGVAAAVLRIDRAPARC